MSADTINGSMSGNIDASVWTVHGVNWHLDVPMSRKDAELDSIHQVHEAATIAIEVFYGADKGLFIVLDKDESEALLHATMIVSRRNTDPAKGFLIFTHEILANCSKYKQAAVMQKELLSELEDIKENTMQHEHIHEQVQKKGSDLMKMMTAKRKR